MLDDWFVPNQSSRVDAGEPPAGRSWERRRLAGPKAAGTAALPGTARWHLLSSNELVNAFLEPTLGQELKRKIKARLDEKYGDLQPQNIDSPAKINALKDDMLKVVNEILVPYKIGSIDKIVFGEFFSRTQGQNQGD